MARPRKELEDLEFDGWDMIDSLILWSDGEYIAWKLGIDYDTMCARIKEKYNLGFSEYRDKKREVIKINIAKKQYDVAMTGEKTMLIWLGKQYLGQSEKQDIKTESAPQKLIIQGLDD